MSDSETLHAEDVSIPKWFLYLMSVILVPIVALVGHLTIQINTQDTRIHALESGRLELAQEIDNQTKEIIQLRLQIERLLVIKPADVYQKLTELEKKIESLQKEVK